MADIRNSIRVKDIISLLIDCDVVFHFDLDKEITVDINDEVLLYPFLDFLVESIDPRENSLLHINILMTKSCPVRA